MKAGRGSAPPPRFGEGAGGWGLGGALIGFVFLPPLRFGEVGSRGEVFLARRRQTPPPSPLPEAERGNQTKTTLVRLAQIPSAQPSPPEAGGEGVKVVA